MDISTKDRQDMMDMIDGKFAKMVKDADLTDSQVRAIDVLLTARNWTATTELMSAGANPASLLNLVCRGIAEQRDSTSSKGYPCMEFRYSRSYYDENGGLLP